MNGIYGVRTQKPGHYSECLVYSLFQNVAKIFHNYDKNASSSLSTDPTWPEVIEDEWKTADTRRVRSSSTSNPSPNTRRSDTNCHPMTQGRRGLWSENGKTQWRWYVRREGKTKHPFHHSDGRRHNLTQYHETIKTLTDGRLWRLQTGETTGLISPVRQSCSWEWFVTTGGEDVLPTWGDVFDRRSSCHALCCPIW